MRHGQEWMKARSGLIACGRLLVQHASASLGQQSQLQTGCLWAPCWCRIDLPAFHEKGQLQTGWPWAPAGDACICQAVI